MNIKDRGDDGICICCKGNLIRKRSLTSEFLSQRAWDGEIEWSYINKCRNCAFAFHSRGLSQKEIANYYLNYRDEKYFSDRNASEFFYTRKVHDELEGQVGGQTRRDALRSYLSSCEVLSTEPDLSLTVLDYAGGKGRLIKDLSGQRYVYDVSGEIPVAGVNSISEDQLKGRSFDLVICAQMLEHSSDPVSVIQELFGYVKNDGYLYIEVPYNETWTDLSGNEKVRKGLLSLAKRFRWFNILLDTYGTAFRVKFKVLPPLAFVPVREHLNYFSPQSLENLARQIGGKVIDVSRQKHLGTVLLVQK